MKDNIVEDLIMIMPLMHRKFFKNMKRHDMKKYTMSLMTIYEHDGQSMSFYCEKLTISKPNFTKMVNELIELGYVKRQVDDEDRRRINIHITEEGAKEVKKRKKFLNDLVGERLTALSQDELEELHTHVLGIHRIINKIEENK